MSKFDWGRQIAALAFTAVFSTVFVLGAVAPAEAVAAHRPAVSAVA